MNIFYKKEFLFFIGLISMDLTGCGVKGMPRVPNDPPHIGRGISATPSPTPTEEADQGILLQKQQHENSL